MIEKKSQLMFRKNIFLILNVTKFNQVNYLSYK